LPEQWTRIISIDYDDLEHFKTYSIASDLLLAEGIDYDIQHTAGQ